MRILRLIIKTLILACIQDSTRSLLAYVAKTVQTQRHNGTNSPSLARPRPRNLPYAFGFAPDYTKPQVARSGDRRTNPNDVFVTEVEPHRLFINGCLPIECLRARSTYLHWGLGLTRAFRNDALVRV